MKNRINIFICVFALLAVVFCPLNVYASDLTFEAHEDITTPTSIEEFDYVVEYTLLGYGYYSGKESSSVVYLASDSPIYAYTLEDANVQMSGSKEFVYDMVVAFSNSPVWVFKDVNNIPEYNAKSVSDGNKMSYFFCLPTGKMWAPGISSADLVVDTGYLGVSNGGSICQYDENSVNAVLSAGLYTLGYVESNFNSNLGYLNNLSHETQYLRGALYNYNEDSRKDIWTFDELTTTGVDLTQGDYMIRHYQQPVLCENYGNDGYSDSEVIEEYDMYLMGTYEANLGKIEYLYLDYEERLHGYGYDGIGFIDAYLRGRFHLIYDYFQIVDVDTGQVGGYVKITPEGASWIGGENENSAVTLTPDGQVDPDGYTGVLVPEFVGSGGTYEEAAENSQERLIAQINGLEGFNQSLNSFSGSIGNVPLMLGNILNIMPSWITGLLALGFSLSVLLIIIKILRG